jgi:broad specificity phosphatase PhoE
MTMRTSPTKSNKTVIHFIRHGEVYNPSKILYARMPRYRLSKKGIEQSKRAGAFLKDRPLVAVYHSPMLRARQSARYIAAPHDILPKNSGLINEIHTPYEGKSLSYIESIDWNIYEGIDPDYEQPEDILKRVKRFCLEVVRHHLGKEVAAVTHGDILIHAQLWAKGLELTHANRRSVQPYPPEGSILTLSFSMGNLGIFQPTMSFHVPE